MHTNGLDMQRPTHRVLIVADRTVDPAPVVDALRERAETQRLEATVMVPASLHGLEWAGDPRATIPAADLHAALLHVALLNAGVESCEAMVGDPDPHAAIDDALRTQRFDEVLINVPSSRLARAFRLGLADRIAPERRAGVTNLRPRRRRMRRPTVIRAASSTA
jgi:hypothetical protein